MLNLPVVQGRGTLVVWLAMVAALALAGCGSTSNLTGPDGKPAVFRPYQRVVVMTVTPTPEDPVKKAAVAEGCTYFTTSLVEALRARQIAAEVSQDSGNVAGALVVSGAMTRFEKGDAGARLLWGFGAGSSYLDAALVFKDGDSGQEVGHLSVNRNSWALGGIIASSQTAESFAEDAARKIAGEVARAMKPQ